MTHSNRIASSWSLGLVTAALVATSVLACNETTDASNSRPPENGTGDAGDGATNGDGAEGFVVAGSIVGTNGEPLEHVEVVADNQLLYDSNLLATTGSDGRYRIELPPIAATWAMSATHSVEYHGKTYSFPLHPSIDTVFAGNAGAVRDFTWKLTGKRPDGGDYGSFVVGYTEPGDYGFELSDVELMLEPEGPLIDGSTGKTIRSKLVRTPDGDAITDVPVGRYTISAKLPSTPLEIRIRNSDAYASSVTSDFDAPYGGLPIYKIEVEVHVP